MAGLLSWGSIYPLGMYFKIIRISEKKKKIVLYGDTKLRVGTTLNKISN